MKGLLHDCRHALRLYAGTPWASLTSVLVLAAGTAIAGSFLSLYVDLILRPHPGFERGGRLVTMLPTADAGTTGMPLELIDLIDEELTLLNGATGIQMYQFWMEDPATGEPVFAEMLARDFFAVAQPRLHLGRGFDARDHAPDAEAVAVISHRLWHDRFGGDNDILGRTISLKNSYFELDAEETAFSIVGVMSPELPAIRGNRETDLWLPFERVSPADQFRQTVLAGLGRLRSGVSAAAVASELNTRFDIGEFVNRAGFRLEAVEGVIRFSPGQQREVRNQLRLLLVCSLMLALVAAANVSIFLLARAPTRRRELATRLAVGAPLTRLRRQLMTEAALLCLAATVLGVALSTWLNSVLPNLPMFRGAEWRDIALWDWRVLGLIGGFAALLTALVALAPTLGIGHFGIATASRQWLSRPSLAQRLTGTLQLGIAASLSGAAIVFSGYLISITLAHDGYAVRDLYTVRDSSGGGLRASSESMIVETSRRREAIMGIPGVTDVAFGSLEPGPRGQVGLLTVPHPLDATAELNLSIQSIDHRYADLLGLELLSGRLPAAGETHAGLVNRSLARQIWGRDDVAGETVPWSVEARGIGTNGTRIVGVLADVSFAHPAADVRPFLFSTGVGSHSGGYAIIESSLGPAALLQSLQGLIDNGTIEASFDDVRSLRRLRDELLAADRARAGLAIAATCLVMLLAAFGLFSTQRYLVAAGRREFAIRATLGAGPRQLGRLVMRRGLSLGLPGLVVSGLLAFIVAAWLRADYASAAISPIAVSVGVMAAMILLVLGASFGPALKACRTEPAPLLRE